MPTIQATQQPLQNGKVRMFSIFENRRYALYFTGQLISLIGTWMQQVALSWFVYSMTKSPFWLAAVGVAAQLPSLLITPFAGVIADRFNRKKIIMITQICLMIEAALLAYVAWSNHAEIWQLIALGAFAGIVTAFDIPTRSAFVVGLVEKMEDLPQAIAMNSTLMNVTRLIGPALAGFLVAAVGEELCFLLNALSYVAVIIALSFIHGNFDPGARRNNGMFAEFKEGFEYTWKTIPVRALILLLAFFSLGSMAYALLLPVFVKQIGGDANTLGYLMSATALGSLVGTLMLAKRAQIVGLGKWIVTSSYLCAASLFALSFAHSFWFAACALLFVGATMMIQMSAANTILQSIIDENKRGRVMSFFTMAFLGTAPIGSLIGGAVADRFGFNTTLTGCAIYCLLVAIVFSMQVGKIREAARPIYIQKGLLEAEEEMDILKV